MLGCLSSFPHIQFFFVLVLITRSSRERKFDSSDEVRQYVWVLEQVNIMNLVRCLFWIAICFLWRDKNICLATIRLYFASLTHAIRTYILWSTQTKDCCIPFFCFPSLFFFPLLFSWSIIFVVQNCKQQIEYNGIQISFLLRIFFYNVLFTVNLIPKNLSNLNQPTYTSKYW